MIEIKEPSESYKEFPGPILILAGPGTGKTYQLKKRIEFLINDLKADPSEIAVITFTKEAARNMIRKLEEDNIPKEKYPKIISTMHSLGNSIIGTGYKLANLSKKYEILEDKNLRIILLKDATRISGFDIEKWKEADDCRRVGACIKDSSTEKCKICDEYGKILRKCSFIDYDDQIFLACEILRTNNEQKNIWKKRTKYLLIDEYQDINQAQCDLIQLLTNGQEEGLFAVGDDQQSIYSFRGGNPKYIIEFEKYFGNNIKIGKLSKSWRCSEHIILGARSMLEQYYKNGVKKPKPFFNNDFETENKIKFYDVPSHEYEAWKIANISKHKIKSSVIKILIPNKNYLPAIKEALKKQGLDYKCKFSFNDEGLIRIGILADWLEDSNKSLKLRYILDLIINNHDDLVNNIEVVENNLKIKKRIASELISDLWSEVNKKNSLYKVINERTKNNTKYNIFIIELRKTLDEIIELFNKKEKNKKVLSSFLKQCGLTIAPGTTPKGLIDEVKNWIDELMDYNITSTYKPIEIYTLQSSKGLEADIIFVVGVSERIIPDNKLDIEEQSRLFFVAMTRAKKELYLFSARKRSSKITYNKSFQIKKSQFIDSIDNNHIEKESIYIKNKRKKAI